MVDLKVRYCLRYLGGLGVGLVVLVGHEYVEELVGLGRGGLVGLGFGL